MCAWLLRLRSLTAAVQSCALTGFLQPSATHASSGAQQLSCGARSTASCGAMSSIDAYILQIACRQWRQLAACKTLACKPNDMQLFEYPSVRYWSKEINGARTGGRKRNIFNSRSGGGRGHRAAAPVESCQSPSKRCPWGRLGSVLYTCKRVRRVRRRFKHFWSNSLSRPLGLAIF